MTERIEVPLSHCFAEMVEQLQDTGLLLASTKRSGESNVMTIGWGTLGVIWSLPIFTVLVRPSRHTYEFIEDSGEFTVNVPGPDMTGFVDFCGARSGRDVDKFAQHHISTRPGRMVSSVTIDACPWVYECRVVHKNDVLPAACAEKVLTGYYSGGDFHRVYYGEVLGVFASVERD
jgi:flavin reductase (DIM6/NTAB) family NADH-FMN oxidoreductase RutF